MIVKLKQRFIKLFIVERNNMIDSSKFVVLDVETNGLSSERDDLLSISIYKPDTNEFYDRFLPLELQSSVLTTEINGITKKMLKDKKPLTQDEFNEVCERFELKSRTILTYGDLDKRFIKRYLARHKIKGFDELAFRNIKDNIISTAYTNGLLTKDNLCIAFGIQGVKDVHSGHNDCVLEWELFKFIDERLLFVSYTNEFCPEGVNHRRESWYIYEFSNDYIVPVSFLHTHPKFKKILKLPEIDIEYEEVFRLEFSKKCSPVYAYQPAGVASEHLITTMLSANRLDSREFLYNNKKKLNYLGSILAEEVETVYYTENSDGTISAVDKEHEKHVEAMNKQTLAIKKEIGPIVEYIKKEIFKGNQILSQELIINNDYNLLGLCDFSNKYGCLECKWHLYNFGFNKRYLDEFKYQLYITSNGRPTYIMVGSENDIVIQRVKFNIK